jgi:AcrR family transcriptional regulator
VEFADDHLGGAPRGGAGPGSDAGGGREDAHQRIVATGISKKYCRTVSRKIDTASVLPEDCRMATTAKAIRTRAALLTALQELMLEPGGDAVTVPRLVAHAGISHGTFYNYFDCLPAAVDAVGALLFAEHLRVVELVNADAADPAEVVARTTRQTLMLSAGRSDIGRLLFDSGLPPERLLRGFAVHVGADILSGIERGSFTVTDVDAAATVCAGAVQGACLDLYRGRLEARSIPDVTDCVLRVLGVEAEYARRLVQAKQEFVPWRPLPLPTNDVDITAPTADER